MKKETVKTTKWTSYCVNDNRNVGIIGEKLMKFKMVFRRVAS